MVFYAIRNEHVLDPQRVNDLCIRFIYGYPLEIQSDRGHARVNNAEHKAKTSTLPPKLLDQDMSNTQGRTNSHKFFSACDQTRSLSEELNDLRGRSSTGSWIDCDFTALGASLGELQDRIAMHYAHEWGEAGALRKAVLDRTLTREQASLFINDQVEVYRLIAELADDVESLLYAMDVAPSALRAACDRFKMFDALFISLEARKSKALKT